MIDMIFLDSNILIYAATDDPLRSEPARTLLESHDYNISTQVINEFIYTCQRKNLLSTEQINRGVEEYLTNFSLQLIFDSTIRSALLIQQRYKFAFWDSLIVATAIECECDTLFTEDLQDGMVIDKSLTIKNPFLSI